MSMASEYLSIQRSSNEKSVFPAFCSCMSSRIVIAAPARLYRQHAVNTAAALFRRSDRRRRSSGRPFVCDDLLEALDTVLGEGRDAILADAVDAQAAVFGEHVDREFV